MKTVTSKDGTKIAFDQIGKGPALVLVGGMFEQRTMASDTAYLAALPLLAEHFSVIHYDRRGRGDSTDTLPFAVEREIEDIEALIDHAGGSAYLSGISSGAALALEAAIKLEDKVKKLAMYEPPYNDEEEGRRSWEKFRQDLKTALAEGRRKDAVGLFMMLLGMPAEDLTGMHHHEMWPMLESVADTIAYDAAALGEEGAVPAKRAAGVRVPTLVMDGGATPYPFMRTTADALAKAMPQGQRRTLEGETHEVKAEVIAPVLIEFFEGEVA